MSDSPETTGLKRIGPYRLVREIGRGAQGHVFLAEDARLSRRVALKVLSSAIVASGPALERFRREAAAASKLDHPGICSVYDAGEADGYAYIAMRFVEGQTLAKQIISSRERALPEMDTIGVDLPSTDTDPAKKDGSSSTGKVLSSRPEILRAMHLIERAARALHAAHESGLIHRDIKPGNLMVTPEGDPVILDFGLARTEDGGLATLTHSGDLLGTPAYMSPEQLLAQRIVLDRRTDIYSLGVTLYECLTLERPFDAPTREGIYQRILTGNAPDPRKLNSHIPRDLKVVIATAMEKDRDRRYKTALDFAEDLRRVREYLPIKAKPAGPALRFGRWVQRNPVLATATGGIFLVLITALVLSLVLLRRVQLESDARKTALQDVSLERDAKGRALGEKEAALEAVKAAGEAREAALARAEGLYMTALASNLLPANPGLALILASDGARRQPGSLSTSVLLSALEASREKRTLVGHEGPVLSVDMSPDGSRAVTAADDGSARVWDIASGKLLLVLKRHGGRVSSARFRQDGARIVTASSDKDASIWDARTGALLQVLRGHWEPVIAAEFLHGGRVLTAGADGIAITWDGETGRELRRFGVLGQSIAAVASPRSDAILTRSEIMSPLEKRASVVKLWDIETGAETPLWGHGALVSAAVFSEDGERIVTGSWDGTARVWKRTGEEVLRLDRPRQRIEWAAFSPDGSLVATASEDGAVCLWNAASGAIVVELSGHEKAPHTGTFSSDGKKLVTASADMTARVWAQEAGGWKESHALRGHDAAITDLRVSTDGGTVLTASRDGTARVWDISDRKGLAPVIRPRAQALSAVVRPDGKRVFYVGRSLESSAFHEPGGVVRTSFREGGIWLLAGEKETMLSAAFSRGGQYVITGGIGFGGNPSVGIHDVRTGSPLRLSYGAVNADVSPDGKHAAAFTLENHLSFYDIDQGVAKVIRTRSVPTNAWPRLVEFAPDGERILTYWLAPGLLRGSPSLRIWDGGLSAFEEVQVPPAMNDSTCRPAFSPTGEQVLVERKQYIAVHDAGSGRREGALETAGMRLPAARMSADGKKVLVGGAAPPGPVPDRGPGGKRAKRPGGSGAEGGGSGGMVAIRAPDAALAADIDPSGTRVLSLSGDDLPSIHEIEGEKVVSLAGHGAPVRSGSFSPDGSRVITASEDGSARVWDSATGREVLSLAHGDAVLSAAFSPDGTLAVTACADRAARIWDLASAKALHTIEMRSWTVPLPTSWGSSVTPFALFSPEGSRLLTVHQDSARLLDGETGKHLHTLRGESSTIITAADFSPDGRSVATSHDSDSRALRLEEQAVSRRGLGATLFSSDPVVRVWDADSGKLRATLRGMRAPISTVLFSPDGSRVLALALDGSLRVWIARSGKTAFLRDLRWQANRASFSPDGARALVSGPKAAPRLIDFDREVDTALAAVEGNVAAAAFSPDGSLVAGATSGGYVVLWSAESGEVLERLARRTHAMTSLGFSPDGRYLVTGSEDRTASVWSVERKSEVISLPHDDAVEKAMFGSGGESVFTVTRDMTVRIWPTRILTNLVAAAEERRPREITPEEASRFQVGSAAEAAMYGKRWQGRRLLEYVSAAEASLEPGRPNGNLLITLAKALADVSRLLDEKTDPAAAAEALLASSRIVAKAGSEHSELAAAHSEILARSGRLREAAMACEEALLEPTAKSLLIPILEKHRLSLSPDIVSFASMDAALERRVPIILEGADWRYMPGVREPSPGLEWTLPEFEDSSWHLGPSGFGFGDKDDATEVAVMQGTTTTLYVRRAFEVSDIGAFEKLVLKMRVDDGFVAYLNGVEIARENAGQAGVRLPADAVATRLAREPLAETEYPVDPKPLRTGKNMLAIQGLNQARNSTDFTLIPVLAGEHSLDPALESRRFDPFRKTASGPDAPARLAYLEGRLLERRGSLREAAARYEEAARAAPTQPEPVLRLAACLRGSKDPAGARGRIAQAISSGVERSDALWDAWIEITFLELRRSLAEAIRDLPGERTPGRGADLRWALDSLSREGALRLRGGGKDLRDTRGRSWGRDRFYQGAPPPRQEWEVQVEIRNAEDPAIYRANRYFPPGGIRPMGYRIPVPPGRYRVRLHFAETYFDFAGQRVFGASIEGKKILEGYEPFSAGKATADIREAETVVDDAFLDIELHPEVENPLVCAIEVIRVDG